MISERVRASALILINKSSRYHRLTLGEVDDVDHIDQLAQLLRHHVERGIVPLDHSCDPGERGVMRRGDVERVDVEAAPGEHSGNAGQHAELIFDEYGDRVSHGGGGDSKNRALRGGPSHP
jgi:hypothetical protein